MRILKTWTWVGAFTVFASAIVAVAAQQGSPAAKPGARVMLDAHNAYPYNGKFADRIDRALAGGLPVAIEQDLVWIPADANGPARSVVSHGAPFDGSEPSLAVHFFERIRPIVESALRNPQPSTWPLVILNLDLKSNEPEHHAALWQTLGQYESWLTTAVRTADGATPAPLTVRPVLVLTGSSDAQQVSFHDRLPVGATLRLFGAINAPAVPVSDVNAARLLPRASNYRRWWNANWSVVEEGGQRKAGDWTDSDRERLQTLVRAAHANGLWVRMWTLNGSDEPTRDANGWSTGYNFGSENAAALRWQAAIEAGVDFVATDQYEAFSALLRSTRSGR